MNVFEQVLKDYYGEAAGARLLARLEDPEDPINASGQGNREMYDEARRKELKRVVALLAQARVVADEWHKGGAVYTACGDLWQLFYAEEHL